MFGALSAQLLIVLIADLEGRALKPFSLWFSSVVVRPTCYSNANVKFGSGLSRFILFLLDSFFLCLNNNEKFEKTRFESSNLFDESVHFEKKKKRNPTGEMHLQYRGKAGELSWGES